MNGDESCADDLSFWGVWFGFVLNRSLGVT